jgi:hypothetical protein
MNTKYAEMLGAANYAAAVYGKVMATTKKKPPEEQKDEEIRVKAPLPVGCGQYVDVEA